MQTAPIVFPVRFVAEGHAVQTTSRALSDEEIDVRCLRPPAVGSRVSMALYLPGVSQPEVAVGIVCDAHEEVEGPSKAGFRARFLAVHPHARERILAVLTSRSTQRALPPPLAPEPPHQEVARREDRAFPRFPVRFRVRFSTAFDFVTEYAENISAGGLFIETLDPPELTRAVSVVLELPDGGTPISAIAIAVHRVTLERSKVTGEQPGCGVQFIDTSDGFRERIDSYIEQLVSAPAQV
ncbi:MAG: PilZ domain-containing protein [Deltaproteobacteria bacterium]|nr:PilZ domain-containing protein [Deltaproteobacteria bacterium]